jgi:GDP/UDP-N,N'-diacetylbacillosamine 2-epimerase (hydrolysing)
MKKICVVTSTRAEYGLLRPLMDRIRMDGGLDLQLAVTGAHLSPEFGLTYREIEKDGFAVSEKIEILLSADTPVGISKTMGLAMISFSECFERLKPDMIVVLGDRYEMFAVVAAASVAKIPVAHISGGETTQGAFDEAFRHSITKMSYLHFTSTQEYRRRVIQLGEQPERVFNVGALGIENIKNMELLSKTQLQNELGFDYGEKTALVTFHPVTLENNTSAEQFENLLRALDSIDGLKTIFTKANADTDGRIINGMIDSYVARNKGKSAAYTSLGQLRYLSAMKYADAVVGNSSSGIVETPAFGIPTVNIGDRQKGRIQAESIINCKPETGEIAAALRRAFSDGFREKIRHIPNPYGDGNTSEKILDVIRDFLLNEKVDLKKRFYDCGIDE